MLFWVIFLIPLALSQIQVVVFHHKVIQEQGILKFVIVQVMEKGFMVFFLFCNVFFSRRFCHLGLAVHSCVSSSFLGRMMFEDYCCSVGWSPVIFVLPRSPELRISLE